MFKVTMHTKYASIEQMFKTKDEAQKFLSNLKEMWEVISYEYSEVRN